MVFVDNRRYYKSVDKQFIFNELTLSYLFRKKNKFIKNGMSYGEIIFQFLLKNGWIKNNISIAEVSCGTGDLMKTFLKSARKLNTNIMYIVCDINSNIIRNIKHKYKIVCDALNLPFINTLDFIISNETLSDLPVLINSNKNELKTFRSVLKHLKGVRDGLNINIGALLFILQIKKALKKHGKALLIENSCENKVNGNNVIDEINLSTHREFRIKFSDLVEFTKSIKMNVIKRGSLNEILGVKNKSFAFLSTSNGIEIVDETDVPFKVSGNSIRNIVEQFEYVVIEKL